MGPGDGNYDGNRYHKKPILRFGDFTDRFNANRMNRSQYAPEHGFRLVSAQLGYSFTGIGQIWPIIAQN